MSKFPAHFRHRTQLVPIVFVAIGLLGIGLPSSYGQIALPTAMPSATVAPVQVGSPTPSPTATPVGPGAFSPPSIIDVYQLARTPSITITLGALAKNSLAARLKRLRAIANDELPVPANIIQPLQRGGVFDEINLGYFAADALMPATSVTLQFDVGRAGASIWVQPLDGGTILVQDAGGNPVSSQDGSAITLNAAGQAAFSFQPLAQAGRYQVLVRLDNVSTVLPFVLLDPNMDN